MAQAFPIFAHSIHDHTGQDKFHNKLGFSPTIPLRLYKQQRMWISLESRVNTIEKYQLNRVCLWLCYIPQSLCSLRDVGTQYNKLISHLVIFHMCTSNGTTAACPRDMSSMQSATFNTRVFEGGAVKKRSGAPLRNHFRMQFCFRKKFTRINRLKIKDLLLTLGPMPANPIRNVFASLVDADFWTMRLKLGLCVMGIFDFSNWDFHFAKYSTNLFYQISFS